MGFRKKIEAGKGTTLRSAGARLGEVFGGVGVKAEGQRKECDEERENQERLNKERKCSCSGVSEMGKTVLDSNNQEKKFQLYLSFPVPPFLCILLDKYLINIFHRSYCGSDWEYWSLAPTPLYWQLKIPQQK